MAQMLSNFQGANDGLACDPALLGSPSMMASPLLKQGSADKSMNKGGYESALSHGLFSPHGGLHPSAEKPEKSVSGQLQSLVAVTPQKPVISVSPQTTQVPVSVSAHTTTHKVRAPKFTSSFQPPTLCGIHAKQTIESDANTFRFCRHPTCQPYEVANSVLVDFMTSKYKIVDFVRLNVEASGALLEVHVFDDLQGAFSFTFGMFALVDDNGGIGSEFVAQVKRTAGQSDIWWKFLGDMKKHLVGADLLDDFDLKMNFDVYPSDTETDIGSHLSATPSSIGGRRFSLGSGSFMSSILGGEELSAMDDLNDFDMSFLPDVALTHASAVLENLESKIDFLSEQVLMDQSRTSMIEGARTLAEINLAEFDLSVPEHEHLHEKLTKIISVLLQSSLPAVLYPTAVFLADSDMNLSKKSKERISQLATDKELGSILRTVLRQVEKKMA